MWKSVILLTISGKFELKIKTFNFQTWLCTNMTYTKMIFSDIYLFRSFIYYVVSHWEALFCELKVDKYKYRSLLSCVYVWNPSTSDSRYSVHQGRQLLHSRVRIRNCKIVWKWKVSYLDHRCIDNIWRRMKSGMTSYCRRCDVTTSHRCQHVVIMTSCLMGNFSS